jgi:predicted enzyme related to lactoylglutathione lyase
LGSCNGLNPQARPHIGDRNLSKAAVVKRLERFQQKWTPLPVHQEPIMGQPVIHFEVIGTEPAKLRAYYAELFGWDFDTSGPVAPAVSEAGNYGFVTPAANGGGIAGGVGGGAGHAPHVVFYIGVPDVEAALKKAESLGGIRRMGPARAPGGTLVVGHFTDPEGNLIGLAGVS